MEEKIRSFVTDSFIHSFVHSIPFMPMPMPLNLFSVGWVLASLDWRIDRQIDRSIDRSVD